MITKIIFNLTNLGNLNKILVQDSSFTSNHKKNVQSNGSDWDA